MRATPVCCPRSARVSTTGLSNGSGSGPTRPTSAPVPSSGGVLLIGLGVGVGLLAGLVGWGLIGLAVILAGLAVIVRNNRFGRRTATGSAVLAQTKGFELYLTTAETEQIKFEEGIDVFSRYLPYAIVFGVAERWTKIFQQLADEGRYAFNPLLVRRLRLRPADRRAEQFAEPVGLDGLQFAAGGHGRHQRRIRVLRRRWLRRRWRRHLVNVASAPALAPMACWSGLARLWTGPCPRPDRTR